MWDVQLLWTHYRQQINWRILYLSWLRRGDAGHTVLVRDIPVPGAKAPTSCLPSVRPTRLCAVATQAPRRPGFPLQQGGPFPVVC